MSLLILYFVLSSCYFFKFDLSMFNFLKNRKLRILKSFMFQLTYSRCKFMQYPAGSQLMRIKRFYRHFFPLDVIKVDFFTISLPRIGNAIFLFIISCNRLNSATFWLRCFIPFQDHQGVFVSSLGLVIVKPR